MANWWGGHFGICGCLPEFWPFNMLTGPVMYPGLAWYLHLAHYNGPFQTAEKNTQTHYNGR